MSISRETFDPTKNYKRIRYHQDRDLLDSELNEQQDIINLERRKIADTREQEPYSFDSDKVSAVRKALPAGDYSLVGLEERVAIVVSIFMPMGVILTGAIVTTVSLRGKADPGKWSENQSRRFSL
jgi:hypothetical protein